MYVKKPNAANITHGLAQIGGGAKKDGGGGMLAGVQNIYKLGVNYGAQQAIGNSQTLAKIESPVHLLFDDVKGDR